MRRACTRCGIARDVNESREGALCRDCWLVERDLERDPAKGECPYAMASQSGYTRHIKEKGIACGPCLEAHRLHMAAWRRAKGMRTKEERYREEGAKCGTPSGYKKHWRNGEKACLDCRIAHTYSIAERKRRRKEQAA